MKQDSNGVRTAQDLERKYDFASILGLKKNVETSEKGLTKVENELLNFMNSTVGNIEDLQSQIDGKVTTWYYNGQPTLENYPVNIWEDDKENHIGDLYYDKETGYCYIFQKETDFSWKKIEDKDVIESLAIANSAKDTADNKRQIFIKEPKTPYDTGDFWINNNEIFICQVTRKTGDFNSKDWINNLKYTDDTVAEAVDGKLTVLSGTVTEITQNYVKYTDLATGGSTTIAGDNIKTGSIKSNNYIENQQGTKISLLDGSIDSKNFKVDSQGNITATNGKFSGDIETSNANINGGSIKMKSTIGSPKFVITDEDDNKKLNIYDTGIEILSDSSNRKAQLTTGGGLQLGLNNKNLLYGYYSNASDIGNYVGLLIINERYDKRVDINPNGISAPSFNNNSLKSLKKNINKFVGALNIIKNTDIYSYNWKNELDNSKKHFGMIIGDEYNTPNEFISMTGDGIDTYAMVSICLQAIKEQQEEIEVLKNKLEEMEAKYDKN